MGTKDTHQAVLLGADTLRPPARFNSSVEWVIVLGPRGELALSRRVNGEDDHRYHVQHPAHLLEMVDDLVAGYMPGPWGFPSRRRTDKQDVLDWPEAAVTADLQAG